MPKLPGTQISLRITSDTRSSKEYRLNQLVIPNRFSKKAFSYMGPTFWNNLDNSIRTATSLDKFKN